MLIDTGDEIRTKYKYSNTDYMYNIIMDSHAVILWILQYSPWSKLAFVQGVDAKLEIQSVKGADGKKPICRGVQLVFLQLVISEGCTGIII